MKYEKHQMKNKNLPFIFRKDEMRAGERDFTHWHENIELLYFYEGKGKVAVDFVTKYTEAGDLFVINTERLHMVESADKENSVKYYCLILDSGYCKENGIPVSELTFKEQISGDPVLIEKFEKVVAAYASSSRGFREAEIRVAVLSLLLTLAKGYLEKKQDENTVVHLENIREAVKYIKAHFARTITIEEVAAVSGYSRAYFSRIFKLVTGYTVVYYTNLVRCRNAAKLLKSGKFKIHEVATKCGFENMSYFSKTYKRMMGNLPSEEVDR